MILRNDLLYRKRVHCAIEILTISIIILLMTFIFIKKTIITNVDYICHTNLAYEWAFHNGTLDGHPLWQIVLGLFLKSSGLPKSDAVVLVQSIIFIFTGCILWFFVNETFSKNLFDENLWKKTAITIFIVLSLMVITPVFLLFLIDNTTYLGYININMFWNPTIVLLKPLALINFYLILKVITHEKVSNIIFLLLLLTTVLSVLAKPVYMIAIIPLIFIAFFIFKFKKKQIKYIILGVVIPGVLALIIPYYVYFYSASSTVGLMPFYVMSYYSNFLVPKFLLSILFPLFVYVLDFKNACKDIRLNMAWILFIIASCYSYLFVETNQNILAGNFVWTGQIANFILFVFSTMYCLEVYARKGFNNIKMIVVSFIFFAHVICGLIIIYRL